MQGVIESNLGLGGIADVLADVRKSWFSIVRLLRLPMRGEGSNDPLQIEVLLNSEELLGVKLQLTEMIYRDFVNSVRVGFSEEPVSRLYIVYELIQFARRLLVRVAVVDELPGAYQLSAWLRLRRSDVQLDAVKLEQLCGVFAEHRVKCGTELDFQALVVRIRRVLVNLALEVLSLDGLHDVLSVGCSSLCPALLVNGEEKTIVREVRHAVELFGEYGRVSIAEQDRLIRGYVRLLRAFRRSGRSVDYSDVVPVLYELCTDNDDGKQLLTMMLCLSGGNSARIAELKTNAGEVDPEFMASVCQTIGSWLDAQRVSNYDSISESLIDNVITSLTRNARDVVSAEDEMWDAVGRVATNQYREGLFARLGYTAEGERCQSPELL